MKQIGTRIKFNRTPDKLEISISQRAKPWQEALLVGWVGLWVLCGFLIGAQLLITSDLNERTFFSIFLGIWLIILIRVFKTLIWRVNGTEELLFEKNKFYYKRSYSGFGRTRNTETSEISEVELIKYSDRSFKKNMESYFWNIGAEALGIKSSKRYFLVGVQLENKDAKLLLDLLKAGVKKY